MIKTVIWVFQRQPLSTLLTTYYLLHALNLFNINMVHREPNFTFNVKDNQTSNREHHLSHRNNSHGAKNMFTYPGHGFGAVIGDTVVLTQLVPLCPPGIYRDLPTFYPSSFPFTIFFSNHVFLVGNFTIPQIWGYWHALLFFTNSPNCTLWLNASICKLFSQFPCE